MEVLKFNLYGKTAHFKKPDVNSYAYYTYNHIHKIAIMGVLGAILGLKGYSQQYIEKTKFPEFYNAFKDVKLGIVPKDASRGYYSKKIITYNNSVGYANIGANRAPCNLVVREQWLEDVSWDIYISLDYLPNEDIKERLIDYLINKKAEYIPYLGKNDHFAEIRGVELLECEVAEESEKIDSLFIYKEVELDDDAYDDSLPFLYRDYMPFALNEKNNKYEYVELAYTNRVIEEISQEAILINNRDNIIFLI